MCHEESRLHLSPLKQFRMVTHLYIIILILEYHCQRGDNSINIYLFYRQVWISQVAHVSWRKQTSPLSSQTIQDGYTPLYHYSHNGVSLSKGDNSIIIYLFCRQVWVSQVAHVSWRKQTSPLSSQTIQDGYTPVYHYSHNGVSLSKVR